MAKRITICAGIDTGKHNLDVAVDGSSKQLRVDNTVEGHQALVEWLKHLKVKRVGIEASGGYEQAVVAELRRKRFIVVLFQPKQVRAYGTFHQLLAKNDKIDAALIAMCTAAVKTVHAAPDPRLQPLAEHLTMIDQITDDISRLKNRLESCRDARIQGFWKAQIALLTKSKRAELKTLIEAIRKHPDLAARLDLIHSVGGCGLPTAVAVLIRMPEIGKIGRGPAAALSGLAPYDDDSGKRSGDRHIEGGRERLRQALYNASLAASFRWNPQLMAFYSRLTAAGKCHKSARVACARKLLVTINAVVARGTPWAAAAPQLATLPAL